MLYCIYEQITAHKNMKNIIWKNNKATGYKSDVVALKINGKWVRDELNKSINLALNSIRYAK